MIIAIIAIGIALCIAFSAIFSASEMSISSCNEMRLENMEDEGNKKAARALSVIHSYDDALSAILIGNNLVNIGASSLGSVLLILLLKTDAFSWISTVVITCLVIIFGETIPKIAAKKNANRFAMACSGFLRLLMFILKPLILLVTFLVDLISRSFPGELSSPDEAIDELSSIIETAEDEDVLEEDQSELVQAAIDFLDITACEAMTSRVDLLAIDIEEEPAELLKIIESSPYSRIPVYEGSIDNIIGVLYLNRFYRALSLGSPFDIRAQLVEPLYVYKTVPLTAVLEQMRQSRRHMAIVCNEYGGTHGIITMEDILEEIVGEIWDESDEIEEDEVKEISAGSFELDGDMSIADFCDLISVPEDKLECASDTVGGWCLEHFESYPKDGDSFREEALKLGASILRIRSRRVESVLITVDSSESDNK